MNIDIKEFQRLQDTQCCRPIYPDDCLVKYLILTDNDETVYKDDYCTVDWLTRGYKYGSNTYALGFNVYFKDDNAKGKIQPYFIDLIITSNSVYVEQVTRKPKMLSREKVDKFMLISSYIVNKTFDYLDAYNLLYYNAIEAK